jgi:hypothetical protein
MGDNMVWRWWAVSIEREWSARQIGFGGSLTRRRIGSMSHAIESYQMKGFSFSFSLSLSFRGG